MNYFIFKQFSRIIHENFGINYSIKKKQILKNRIDSRLKELNLNDYNDYLLLLKTGDKKELQELADKITTNTTYFFREPEHFDFLKKRIFNEINNGKYSTIRIWSAPCSTGEELYSIGMTAQKFKENNNNFAYKIYGSDISDSALNKAKTGIYSDEDISNMKLSFKSKYFEKVQKQHKIKQVIRQNCMIYKMNFMEDELPSKTKFDVIFCRNLLMYFKKEEQQKIVNNLCERLNKNGYFFISQNESLHGLDIPLKQVSHSIFQKK